MSFFQYDTRSSVLLQEPGENKYSYVIIAHESYCLSEKTQLSFVSPAEEVDLLSVTMCIDHYKTVPPFISFMLTRQACKVKLRHRIHILGSIDRNMPKTRNRQDISPNKSPRK